MNIDKRIRSSHKMERLKTEAMEAFLITVVVFNGSVLRTTIKEMDKGLKLISQRELDLRQPKG